MKGCVYRRKGAKTWSFAMDLPRGEDGRRRKKYVGGFRTQKDAASALRTALHKLEHGGDPFPEKMRLGEYLDRWLDHQRSRIRASTHERYTKLLRDHVRPVIGNLELSRIKPAHVREVMDQMTRRGLAPRTVVQARAVLGGAMRQAVADGLIPYSPVSAVKPPRPERPDLDVPTRQQLVSLVEAARGTPWEIPVLLAATTGARRSEVLAVRWADVDLDAARVRIMRGLHRVPAVNGTRDLAFLDPKTTRARRPVGLHPVAVERLRQWRVEQARRRLALGEQWVDLDLVCERGDGGMLDPDAFTKAFKRLARQAGLSPRTRLHDVRHAVATELARRGVHSVIVSAMLGHSSPAFTASVYQHEWAEGFDQAAAAMGEALSF